MDHDIVRDGLKRVLEELPGTTTFGEASTAAVPSRSRPRSRARPSVSLAIAALKRAFGLDR